MKLSPTKLIQQAKAILHLLPLLLLAALSPSCPCLVLREHQVLSSAHVEERSVGGLRGVLQVFEMRSGSVEERSEVGLLLELQVLSKVAPR